MHAGIETRAALRVGAALCAHAHALHRHASHPHRDRDKEPHGPHLFRTNAGTDALAAPGKGGLSPGLVPVPDKEPRAHERETCLVPCLERAARPGVAAAHNEPSAAENGGKPQDGSAEISMDKETCVVGTAISDLLRENGGKYRDSKRERRRGGGDASAGPDMDICGDCEVSGVEWGSWDGLCVDAAVPKGLFKRHMYIRTHIHTCIHTVMGWSVC